MPAAVLQGKVAGLSTTVRVKPKIGGVVLAKEDGLPLPGVKIQLLNKQEAVTTNAKGEFTLPIDSLNQTVVLSAIGFKTKEVNINAAKPNTIILEPAQNSLNEIVVTSYGTQKKQAEAASSTVLLPQAAPLNGWVAYQDYLKINNKFSTATPVGKTVELTFKIDRKGNPTNISITKSQGKVFDEEAIRLLKNGPKWIYDPNMVQGKLTINF
jgi:TonB family protein